VLALNEISPATGVKRFRPGHAYLDDVQQRIIAELSARATSASASASAAAGQLFLCEVTAAQIKGHGAARWRRPPDAITIFCTNLRGAPLVAELESGARHSIYDTIATVLWKVAAHAGRGHAPDHPVGASVPESMSGPWSLRPVVRNADIVTAQRALFMPTSACARGGWSHREKLPPAAREIRARAPHGDAGGVDAPLPSRPADERRLEDGGRFPHRNALRRLRGTTTLIPFACPMKGGSLRAAVEGLSRRAAGKALVDYAFPSHRHRPDPGGVCAKSCRPHRRGLFLVQAVHDYDDLKLDDRQMIDILAVARREGAMTMIHAGRRLHRVAHRKVARSAGCIRRSAMPIRGRWSRAERPPAPSRLAELLDTPVLIVHVSGREAIEQIRWGQARGLPIRADLPAIPVPTRRFLEGGFEGGEVHLAARRRARSQPPRRSG